MGTKQIGDLSPGQEPKRERRRRDDDDAADSSLLASFNRRTSGDKDKVGRPFCASI
jgi:hypothetical protein